MPVNLSFTDAKSTGSFYSSIHRNIAAQGATTRLPPTAAEFAAWLGREFSDVSQLSALDGGCGVHALNARACRSRGFAEVWAIDVNPDAVAAGRDIGVMAGSVLDLPFPSDRFDLVICSGVAHHTPDPGRALSELARVLKPGGCAYFAVYTFRRSAFEYLVRGLRFFGQAFPYRWAQALFGRVPILNNFVLDHMYVPILWVFRAPEVRALVEASGLAVETDFPTRFDIFAPHRLGRWLVADGLLRVFVCRKPR